MVSIISTVQETRALLRHETTEEPSVPVWYVSESTITYKHHFNHGSFGSIYYGTWRGVPVVVKRLRIDTKNQRLNNKLQTKFIEEADLWYHPSHPHILQLYGACHDTSPPFFVCEQAMQGDLSTFLSRDKSRMWRLLYQSACAIEYLHTKDIVHGDLKLNNILVGGDGKALVADFGLSRIKQRKDPKLTRYGSELEEAGAVEWRAPEALDHKAIPASDIYSFAMFLIEAISGESPYAHYEDEDDIVTSIQDGRLPHRPREMSQDIWDLVLKMTRRDRQERITIEGVLPILRQKAELEEQAELSRNQEIREIIQEPSGHVSTRNQTRPSSTSRDTLNKPRISPTTVTEQGRNEFIQKTKAERAMFISSIMSIDFLSNAGIPMDNIILRAQVSYGFFLNVVFGGIVNTGFVLYVTIKYQLAKIVLPMLLIIGIYIFRTVWTSMLFRLPTVLLIYGFNSLVRYGCTTRFIDDDPTQTNKIHFQDQLIYIAFPIVSVVLSFIVSIRIACDHPYECVFTAMHVTQSVVATLWSVA